MAALNLPCLDVPCRAQLHRGVTAEPPWGICQPTDVAVEQACTGDRTRSSQLQQSSPESKGKQAPAISCLSGALRERPHAGELPSPPQLLRTEGDHRNVSALAELVTGVSEVQGSLSGQANERYSVS